MQRYRQTLEEISGSLTRIKTSWQDELSDKVINIIQQIPQKPSFQASDIEAILDLDYEAGLTTIRLILDLSKDELNISLKSLLNGGTGVNRYKNDKTAFIDALIQLGTIESLTALANNPVSWRELLIEGLKSGRGSAIKGQKRGRFLEDFVEGTVRDVFGEDGFDLRCRFIGANGLSTEKTDFAIPSKSDPSILIEVKAYGATGSKQTDILGDMARIVQQKRHDTHLLFVTDGITWLSRLNDLRKLVEMQNRGEITRIYTSQMKSELEKDLKQLKMDHSL